MATYIKNDIQNILTDIYNRNIIITIIIYYRVLRTTLYNYLNNTQSYRNIYNDK